MRVMRSSRSFAGLILAVLAVVSTPSAPAAQEDPRPNILLLVADDLGYADLGSFGSDIRTPNLDALASEGVRFTQFHTAPMCAPTRAMLLTGNNNHVAGMGQQSRRLDLPGYEARLSDRVIPFPRLLRQVGYHTYTAGKWHLGDAPEHAPPSAGFERSFNLVHGAGSHFSATGFFEGGSVYRADGVDVGWPEGGYSTEVFTDELIRFIEEGRGDGRPFFAFAAYTSPHWPLQVPEPWLDRYRGRYDEGYDALRERRFRSLQAAGIVPASSSLPPRNPAITPWDSLSAGDRRVEARKMELYAAMLENLDHHVGRLVQYLKDAGLYENTLVVFMSDNGAAAEDFYERGRYAEYLRAHYDNSYENMGRPGSWVSYGPQWAEAGSAPFSRHKGYARQGGIVAPMIVAGPGVEGAGRIDDAYVTVMDLAPTFLEVAGAHYPRDASVRPILGASMAPLLSGEVSRLHDEHHATTLFHAGVAYLRQGRWKLVTLEPPFDESRFELFDVVADPGETKDLRHAEPERYQAMLRLWRSELERLGIVIPPER